MNPVAELLGAASSGAGMRHASRPQKGSGEFQLLLDQARRAFRSDDAAAQAPAGARADQATDGSERLPGSHQSGPRSAKPQQAVPASDAQAGAPAADASPPDEGDAGAGFSEVAALIAGGAAAAPTGEAQAALDVSEPGLGGVNAQPDAIVPSGPARPDGEPSQRPLPDLEAKPVPTGGDGSTSGAAPQGQSEKAGESGSATPAPARDLTGARAQAGSDPGRTSRPQPGESSLAAARRAAAGPTHPLARAAHESTSELAARSAGAQTELPVSAAHAGSPALDGARGQLAFLFRGLEVAPVEEPAAQGDLHSPPPPDAKAVPAAPGAPGSGAWSADELHEAIRTQGADDADATARPAGESMGQLPRHDGAALTEPPSQEEATPSFAGQLKAAQTPEGGRFAPLARPVLQQMVRSAQVQLGEEVSTLHLQLKPANLGDLDLRLSVEHGVLTAKFVTHSLEVKALIESALPELRQSLQEQGVPVEQLSVSVGEDRRGWDERGREAGARGGTGAGYASRASLEAATAPASASTSRMWYSQGVDILV